MPNISIKLKKHFDLPPGGIHHRWRQVRMVSIFIFGTFVFNEISDWSAFRILRPWLLSTSSQLISKYKSWLPPTKRSSLSSLLPISITRTHFPNNFTQRTGVYIVKKTFSTKLFPTALLIRTFSIGIHTFSVFIPDLCHRRCLWKKKFNRFKKI